MALKFVTYLLIAIGLFTVTGVACHSDNEVIAMVRDAFDMEKGCTFRDNY